MNYGARIDTPTGSIDGANTVFVLPRQFVGEPVVFVNGLAKLKAHDDGWTHDGSSVITMKKAPEIGDSLQVWYLPRF